MKYQITVAPSASKMLKKISDQRVVEKIRNRIDLLTEDPDQQGKPLADELAGYLSVRAVGQRYRIIYRIERDQILVFVIAVGLRRDGSKHDIYSLAKKLVKFHLVEPKK